MDDTKSSCDSEWLIDVDAFFNIGQLGGNLMSLQDRFRGRRTFMVPFKNLFAINKSPRSCHQKYALDMVDNIILKYCQNCNTGFI